MLKCKFKNSSAKYSETASKEYITFTAKKFLFNPARVECEKNN